MSFDSINYQDIFGLKPIPKGWRVKRLKFIALVNPSKTEISHLPDTHEVSFLPMELLGEGTVSTDKIKTLGDVSQGFTYFRDGDILIAKITPSYENGKGGIAIGLTNGIGFGTTELHILRPLNGVDKRFLYYVTVSRDFREIGAGMMQGTAGQKRVPDSFIENYPVFIPSISEQKVIADYLDHEIARIDSLVVAKERLLRLLIEKRRAVITHAVTRGLNHNISLKESGVGWLGEIPSHWNIEYARWLFREIDERSTEHGEEELLSVSHLTGVTTRADKEVNMFMAESNEGYKICRQGDLVINTLWAWMGAMGIAFQDGIVSPAYNVYRLREKYIPEYIDVLVRIPIFAQEVTRFSRGVWSSRLRLYPEEFFKVQMPVPPLSEQREIVKYVKSQTEKIDRLFELAQKTIEHLHERRASLIAAVVSGQIKVE